jgi:dihydropyrimidinase
MAYKGALMIDDRQMYELMEELVEHGGIMTAHTENGDMIDSNIQKNLEAGNTEPRLRSRGGGTCHRYIL